MKRWCPILLAVLCILTGGAKADPGVYESKRLAFGTGCENQGVDCRVGQKWLYEGTAWLL